MTMKQKYNIDGHYWNSYKPAIRRSVYSPKNQLNSFGNISFLNKLIRYKIAIHLKTNFIIIIHFKYYRPRIRKLYV